LGFQEPCGHTKHRDQGNGRKRLVTLEGNVDWKYRKAVAESLLKKLKDVMGIDNHIEIKPKVSPKKVKERY
jgi:hypothetical protein